MSTAKSEQPSPEVMYLPREDFLQQYADFITSDHLLLMQRDEQDTSALCITESGVALSELDVFDAKIFYFQGLATGALEAVKALDKRDKWRERLEGRSKVIKGLGWFARTIFDNCTGCGMCTSLPRTIRYQPLDGEAVVIVREVD